MASRITRLRRLEATLIKLKDVIAGRLAALAAERQMLQRQREAIAQLMNGDTRFLDLTTGGALRRLNGITARLSAIDGEEVIQRRRAASAVQKARRAADSARAIAREQAKLSDRQALSELTDQLRPASLRQVDPS